MERSYKLLEDLPNEIVEHIISFLYPYPIHFWAIRGVCRTFYKLCTSEASWIKICRVNLHWPNEIPFYKFTTWLEFGKYLMLDQRYIDQLDKLCSSSNQLFLNFSERMLFCTKLLPSPDLLTYEIRDLYEFLNFLSAEALLEEKKKMPPTRTPRRRQHGTPSALGINTPFSNTAPIQPPSSLQSSPYDPNALSTAAATGFTFTATTFPLAASFPPLVPSTSNTATPLTNLESPRTLSDSNRSYIRIFSSSVVNTTSRNANHWWEVTNNRETVASICTGQLRHSNMSENEIYLYLDLLFSLMTGGTQKLERTRWFTGDSGVVGINEIRAILLFVPSREKSGSNANYFGYH